MFQMKSNSSHKIRRIIAEDPEWNLILIPSLSELSITKIINTPSFSGVLSQLLSNNFELGENFNNLPSSISLDISIPFIGDEKYWKINFQDKWKTSPGKNELFSWKQSYLQNNLQELIEQYIPLSPSTDFDSFSENLNQIESLMKLSAGYVNELVLTELHVSESYFLQIRKDSIDINCVDQFSIFETNEHDHFPLSLIFKCLYNLESIEICYGVNNIGMNFEWKFFSISDQDCKDIINGLQYASKLRKFVIINSQLNSKQAKLLCPVLATHSVIRIIDLSHNKICDKGFQFLGKILSQASCKITHLNISNNLIGFEGSKYFSLGLERNSTLQYLNLRLNKIKDEGADLIFQALNKNITLRSLNLSSNMLTELCCKSIADILVSNKTLTNLDLSCNYLDESGGKLLQERINDNFSLLEMNLSLTYISHESNTFISQTLNRNRKLT